MLGGVNCGPQKKTCSKAVSPQNQAKHLLRVHTGGEGKNGKVWHRNSPSKATNNFPLLLDGKLTRELHCSGFVIFSLRD